MLLEPFEGLLAPPEGVPMVLDISIATVPPGYDASVEFFNYYIMFLSPVALLSNCFVIGSCVMFLRSHLEPRTAYMVLGNIATADTLAFLSGLLGLISYDSNYFCAIQAGSITTCSLASMLSICLIAVERFLYIVHGIKYQFIFTPARVGFLIALVWLAAICCGLVPMLVQAHRINKILIAVDCEFILTPTPVALAASVIAIPSLVFTPIAYIALYCHIRRLSKRSLSGPFPAIKCRSILVVFLSSCCFFLCWGPLIIGSAIYKLYCEPRGFPCRELQLSLIGPLACLGYTNSLLNPIIYAWWHPPYNRAIRKLVCPKSARASHIASLFGNGRSTP